MTHKIKHLRRIAARLVGAGLLTLGGVSGCGSSLITGVDDIPPASPDQGWLKVTVRPKNAELHVDGRFFGTMDGYREGLLRLPRGQHRIELRAPNHYAWYGQVTIDAEPVRIETELVTSPPEGR